MEPKRKPPIALNLDEPIPEEWFEWALNAKIPSHSNGENALLGTLLNILYTNRRRIRHERT